MSGLRAAIGFLTVFPVGRPVPSSDLVRAPVWFPVVGLLLGTAMAVADRLLRLGHRLLMNRYPPASGDIEPLTVGTGLAVPILQGVILVGLMAVMTRGLHLDGFMDTCDALPGGHDRRRRLEILRDARVGAFAVVGAFLLLLVKCAALAALPVASRSWTIVLVPCLARWAVLVVMRVFPYARERGLATPFLEHGNRRDPLAGLGVALAATAVLTGPMGLVLVAGAGAMAWAVGAWATRLLGGVTGDIYGTVCETTEAFLLVAAVILTLGDPAALSSPLVALAEALLGSAP